MKYFMPFILMLIGLAPNIFGQIDDTVFSSSMPRELKIRINKNVAPLESDLPRLRIIVYSKTPDGNVEIQSPAPIKKEDITLVGNKTLIRVAVLEDLSPAKSYIVVINGYKIGDKTFSFDPFTVAPKIKASVFYNVKSCEAGIQLVVNVPKAFKPEGDEILDWLKKIKPNPSESVKLEIAQGNEEFRPDPIRFLTDPKYIFEPVDEKFDSLGFNEINACFYPENEIFGTYALKLNFTREDTPIALKKEFKSENFGETSEKPTDITKKDAFVRKGDPGQRTLDNDIEAGFTMTNFKDNTTGKRVTRATLDLQVAPIRNRPFLFIKGNEIFSGESKNIPEWFGYWTPVFLDANISTGKITSNTLSLNRIAIGGNFEFRYVPLDFDKEGKTDRFATYQIFKINYTHYSDRDFKQNEIVAGFEYSPIFGRLNRPRKMNFEYIKRPSSGKFVRAPGKSGYTFVPSFGVDFGRTYSRRNPASAIEPSANIRRLFTKLTGRYEYDIFGFTVTDQLYYRGESETDKLNNYFEADFETLLNNFSNNFKHAVFLNYKRGSAPPFNSKADALTVGYRIRINR